MLSVRPLRLALTATLTLAGVAVVTHPWTNPGPVQKAAPAPIDTIVTTADPANPADPGVPSLPTVSGGRVDVARRVAPVAATDSGDIPVTAMVAYQRAATVVNKVDSTCGLSWTLLAAVGGVESDHGRNGGAVLGDDGVSTPLIRGVALDGKGNVARVADTDAGQTDGDQRWDRAVGPMQFLPSTWATVGVDADGDGKRSADDIDDAALGAAVFLCSAPGSLDTRSGMRVALHRYNPSAEYVARVIALEHEYRTGDYALPDLPDDGPVVIRAGAPPVTGGNAGGGGTHHQHADTNPHGDQVDPGDGHHQQGGGGGADQPDPSPTPDPTPDPTPTEEPEVTPTEVTGVLQQCGTDTEPAWCVDDTVLDVGDADYLAAVALADFDADGTVETNADELTGLAGTEVTLEITMLDDAPAPLLQIAGVDYVEADDANRGR